MSLSFRERYLSWRWPVGFFLVAAAGLVEAQTVPRLTIESRVSGSQNPLLLPGDDRQALLLEVSARPGVNITTTDGSTFDLGAAIIDRGYSRRYGDYLVGNVAGRADYRDSEYLSIGVSASASRDVAVDLLTSSVEAAADPASVRDAYRGRLSLTAHADAHTWIRPEIGVEKSNFSDSNFLGDTRAIDASLAITKETSDRLRLGLRGGAIFSDTARLSSVSTQFVYATLDRQLSEGWRATGELGVERTGERTESLLGISARQPARFLLSGRGEFCRTAPDPVVCVRGSLNSEVSGLGGLQRRAVAGASFHRRLGESASLDLDAEYQRAVMQGDIFPPFDAIRATALLARKLTRALSLAGEVQYLRRRLIEGRRIGAAFLGLRLTYAVQRR